MLHFREWQNMLDSLHLVLTPITIVNSLTQTPMIFEQETSNYFAALVSFSVIAKSFDWLKLFDCTAFYMLLIE